MGHGRSRQASLTAAAMMKYSSAASVLVNLQRETTRVVTIKDETTERATTTPMYIRLLLIWRAVTGRPCWLAEIAASSAISAIVIWLVDHSVHEGRTARRSGRVCTLEKDERLVV